MGEIFGESLIRGKNRSRHVPSSGHPNASGGLIRILFFCSFFALVFSVLFIRLFHVTVVEGYRYRTLSEENRLREVRIPAPRGIIYDQNRVPVTRNIPVYKTPEGDFSFERNESGSNESLTEMTTREYVFPISWSHILGYIGQVSDTEIGKPIRFRDHVYQTPEYGIEDTIGRMGVEQVYDGWLRGEDGKEFYEVDAVGRRIRLLGKVDPVPGRNLILTIDHKLQNQAAETLTRPGAIVMTRPKTGEILALYSYPGYDPNDFIRGVRVETWFSDSSRPMFNRAVSGLYPPGSTFKLISAVAGLETGAVTRDQTIEDVGILTIGDFSFGNWYFLQYGKTDGWVNIEKAIARSNDIYFYKLGEMMGVRRLAEWGRIFGMGKPLGIDLPAEEAGVMSDPEWRKRVKGTEWYLGDTYHVSIGQGELLATPIQVNAWTSVIASDGLLCRPHLVSDPRVRVPMVGSLSECLDLHIKPATIHTVKNGMVQACQEGGTGSPFFHFSVENTDLRMDNRNFFDGGTASGSAASRIRIPVACKTGTAEFGDPKNRTHAWFTAFAPVEDPEISVTVLVESGGEGSSVAAPIAKKNDGDVV